MKRAKVTLNCVADFYHLDRQRIVEFSFPNGEGGLIEFYTDDNGHNQLHVYRTDENILISVGTETAVGYANDAVRVNIPTWAKW